GGFGFAVAQQPEFSGHRARSLDDAA
ncbi:MAG: hypothetical protein QOH12_2528, partial [Solirubrobacteraceae bacterium]|nr:hypothetical protein [Solirubrobacteraceae bacterium]